MPFFGPIDGVDILTRLIAFVVAITIHEFMHAYTAYRLGDPTAARLGRITLNPAAHFDPLGFIFLLLILFGIPALAWGKPVPFNPGNFRDPKRGAMLVAAAGPLSNLVQAAVFVVPLWVAPAAVGAAPPIVQSLLYALVGINLALAAFNMIPIPPLDGHKILTGLLPDFWYPVLAPLERYGFALLLLVIFVPGFLGIDLLGPMIGPPLDLLNRLVFPS